MLLSNIEPDKALLLGGMVAATLAWYIAIRSQVKGAQSRRHANAIILAQVVPFIAVVIATIAFNLKGAFGLLIVISLTRWSDRFSKRYELPPVD